MWQVDLSEIGACDWYPPGIPNHVVEMAQLWRFRAGKVIDKYLSMLHFHGFPIATFDFRHFDGNLMIADIFEATG